MKTKSINICSFILKVIVFLAATIGTVISAAAGRNSFMGGGSVFMYFTIQSNIAIALVSIIGLVLMIKKIENRFWEILRLVFTVSITLTGFVFCFVLAPTMGKTAWRIQNVLTHVVSPISAIVDFFLYRTKIIHKKSDTFYVIIPPLCYAIYAGIGYVLKWEFAPNTYYPYFFLNWGSEAGAFGFTNELPFLGCAYWILLLLGFLILIGSLYLYFANKRSSKLAK